MKLSRNVLNEKAQEELLRDHVIGLLTIIVPAQPDPDRPDDRLAMKLPFEMYHEFAAGRPETEAALAQIRGLRSC
jgi:hypothetical protein